MIEHDVWPITGEQSTVEHGLHTFSAEFFTSHRVIRADLTSPERRLSDHLNGSVTSIDIQPVFVSQRSGAGGVNLVGSSAFLMKTNLLFVVPLKEPARNPGPTNSSWKSTARRKCWFGVGAYRVLGSVHLETGRDASSAIRLFDKQFLPVTGGRLTLPNGDTRDCSTLILNRSHVDLIAFCD